jgi:hypothetical protein
MKIENENENLITEGNEGNKGWKAKGRKERKAKDRVNAELRRGAGVRRLYRVRGGCDLHAHVQDEKCPLLCWI